MDFAIKTVDILLLKRYGQVVLFLSMLFLAIAFIMVLFESLEPLMDASAPLHLGTLYLILRLPHEFLKVVPMVVVIAMAVTIGDMIRHHEINVLLIAGYSPLRLLAPLATVLMITVGTLYFLYENVAGPSTTLAHNVMETQIKGGGTGLNLNNGIWLFGDNNRIYHVETYFPHQMELRGFTMFVFQGDSNTVSERFDADSAVWNPSSFSWTLNNIVARKIHPNGSIDRHIMKSGDYDLERVPSDFERVTKKNELMPRSELKHMVDLLESAGEDPNYYLADLRIKEAYPFSILFLGVLTFYITVYKGSAGRASGVGISILLVIAYYMALMLGKSLCNAGVVTAVFGAWYPNLISFFASIYYYYQVRNTA